MGRAVVIGGSGQIGGWLLRTILERGDQAVGTYATVPFPGLVALDAADLAASADWLRGQEPEVVFYPAGFTWVDGCERDPAKARASNLEQPLNLARATDAKFVYFSTDYVFDGVNGPYDEDSPTRPLSAYGQAKLDAEHALLDVLGDRVLILRTSWVFGPERQGKNFACQLLTNLVKNDPLTERQGLSGQPVLVRNLARRQPITCPSDQVSSPSYGPDVARASVSLANQGRSGLVHLAGPEVMNRVTFARGIAEGFGLDPSLIHGKTTEELGQGAPRPLNGGLLTPKLDAWLPGAMRPLADSLADFRARLDADEGWASPFPPA